MIETIEIGNEQISAIRDEVETPTLELGNSRLGLGVIMVMAAFVGVWGVICLVSGLGNCGDAQELSRGLMVAMTGM